MRSVLLRLVLAAACLAPLAACGDDAGGPAAVQETDPAKATYAPELGIVISTMTKSSTGLYSQDVVVGGGAAAVAGKRAYVRYTGALVNGSVFDSNREAGDPLFSFVVGGGGVIRGWDEGVAGMKEGGRRKLVIPPALGYGSSALSDIPANSILVFDIELVRVL